VNMELKWMFLHTLRKLVVEPWARITRGKTLGARVAVFDEQNRVFLVRHTYSRGWILPGGGVDAGETLAQAALRELREEGGIIGENPVLHGMFSNERIFKGDHVACFVLRKFSRVDWKPNREISDAQFFPLSNLPEDLTGGTRRRLAEIVDGVPNSEMW
jgi:8-oxo-dGTP pyrophosphatase MutT (NUDIX family)